MRFSFKKAAAAAMIAGCLSVAVPAANAGGIPVFDGAAVAQSIEQGIRMGQQIQNQIKQISAMKQQITTLKDQLKANTGTRNLGNILQTQAMEQLPDEWKSVYSSVRGFKDGNYTDLLGTKGYDKAADAERLVKHYDLTLRAIKDSEIRFKNIKDLMAQIDRTQDMKAAADLQNRIAIESSYIQQNQTNLDMLERFMTLQEKVQVKKRQAANSCIRQNRLNRTSNSCS